MSVNASAVANFESLAAGYIAKNMTEAGIVDPMRELPDTLFIFLDMVTLNSALLTAVSRGFITPEELDAFIQAAAARRQQAIAEERAKREARMAEILTTIENGETINPQSAISIPLGRL
jgi:hypothetical protein